ERENDIFGDPLQRIWKGCIFDLCGVPQFHRRMFNIMVLSSPEQRANWLQEVASLVDTVFPQ
ncbi:MAG: flavodoxin family protein, partial [Desulfuromonadales bacterium]|nr:flavodoxin family protein [Desulfuromonadales bacterium]